jgi:serine/threonine-protein kinase
MPSPSLLQRLKERKLVQWALAYLAGAWVLFEVADAVGGRWNLPDVLFQGLAVVLAIGFFVALVVAWYHGEKGRQRVSGLELLMVAALLVIAGVALSTLGPEASVSSPSEPVAILPEEDQKPSIAVLPLQHRSGVEEDAYFTDGMHDQIITQLTKINGLSVRGLTSVLVYRDSPKNLREIGEELNARYILEGGVQRAGELVRISVQLIEAATDEHIWAYTYDRTMSVENVFSIQTEIVEAVTDSVRAVVTPDERARMAARPTENGEAFDFLMRGDDYVRRSYEEEDRRIAIQMYERAIQSDPKFALAYARLSYVHSWMWWEFHDRTPARLARAGQAVEEALRLDPNLPEAHEALGWYHYWGHLEHDRALAEFRIAQVSQPNNAGLYGAVGAVQRRQGRTAEALANHIKAAELDPRSVLRVWGVAQTLVLLRDAEEASRYFDRAISLGPDWRGPYLQKAMWLELRLLGDTEEARATLERAEVRGLASPVGERVWCDIWERDYEGALHRLDRVESEVLTHHGNDWVPKAGLYADLYGLMGNRERERAHRDSARSWLEARLTGHPDDAWVRSALGIAYAGLGRNADAVREGELAAELLPMSKDAWYGAFRIEDLARIYVMVGEPEAAIERLEGLLDVPSPTSVSMLRIDPTWDPLRSHPGFQALLERYAPDKEGL